MHDFLHAYIGRIYQNFIIHVGTEEPFTHSRLEEAKAVITFLGTQLLQKLYHTRHPVDFLIENHTHHLVQLHLLAINITDDINHILRLRRGISLHFPLHLLMLCLDARNQHFLLIAEDFINRTLRHMEFHGNLVHLHCLHPTLIKLGHGKSNDFITQFQFILLIFYHFFNLLIAISI